MSTFFQKQNHSCQKGFLPRGDPDASSIIKALIAGHPTALDGKLLVRRIFFKKKKVLSSHSIRRAQSTGFREGEESLEAEVGDSMIKLSEEFSGRIYLLGQ